jgi:hypothetical protein
LKCSKSIGAECGSRFTSACGSILLTQESESKLRRSRQRLTEWPSRFSDTGSVGAMSFSDGREAAMARERRKRRFTGACSNAANASTYSVRASTREPPRRTCQPFGLAEGGARAPPSHRASCALVAFRSNFRRFALLRAWQRCRRRMLRPGRNHESPRSRPCCADVDGRRSCRFVSSKRSPFVDSRDGETGTDDRPRRPGGEPDAPDRRSSSTLHRDDFQWRELRLLRHLATEKPRACIAASCGLAGHHQVRRPAHIPDVRVDGR